MSGSSRVSFQVRRRKERATGDPGTGSRMVLRDLGDHSGERRRAYNGYAVCAGEAGGFLAGAVASTLRRSRRLMATETLTFLFTDIEDSTAMVQRLGAAWAGVLADHHRLIRAGVTTHGGEEVVTPGDGVFAVFASPRACVDAVIQMQRALVSHAWPARERVRVRMGIHCGEASQTAAGVAVHEAARIAAAAHGCCRPRRPGCWSVRCRTACGWRIWACTG
jgi:class 3 adenylate cyclase